MAKNKKLGAVAQFEASSKNEDSVSEFRCKTPYHENSQVAATNSGAGQVREVVNPVMFNKPITNGVEMGRSTELPSYKERMSVMNDNLDAAKEHHAYLNSTQGPQAVYKHQVNSLKDIVHKDTYQHLLNSSESVGATSVTNGVSEFYARQLTEFYPLLMFTKYPQLQYSEYTSIYNGAPYATEIANQMFDYTGLGDQFSDDGTRANESNDTIVVGTKVNESNFPVFTSHLAIDFEQVEQWAIQQAPTYGVGGGGTSPIIQAKFMALNRAQEVILNERCLAVQGNTAFNYTGIFNEPTVPRDTIGALPGAVAGAWSTKTPDEILTDIIVAYNFLNTQSRGIHTANTLVMSNAAYNIFRGLPRSAFSDLSVDQWVVRNMPNVARIVPDTFLDGIGAGGSEVMFLTEKAPDNHYFSVNARSFGMRPDYYTGHKLRLPFMLRSTGWILLRSLSCLIVEGL